MHCRKCQKELPEAALFCCWCGAPQIRQRREKTDIAVPKPTRMTNGEWRIQLRLDGQSTVIKAETERECIAKAKAAKLGILEIKRCPEKTTLSQAIDKHIETHQLSASTIRGYRAIQQNRFPELMQLPMGEITQRKALQAITNAYRTLSTKSVKSAWALVKTVMQEQAGIDIKVSLSPVVSDSREWLDPEQIKTFCEALQGTDAELGALLALSSLRRSEIYALTWEDIDLRRRVIHVRGAMVQGEGGELVRQQQNKTNASRRDVPIMSERLYELLTAADKKKPIMDCYIGTLTKRINAVCEKANLPLVGLHGLRHSFASLSASLQVPEHVTMQIGGWSDPTVMRKIYTHVATMDIAKTQNKLTDFFNTNCL